VFTIIRLRIVAFIMLAMGAVTPLSAHAATAAYVEPELIADADLAALSAAGDGAGFSLGMGDVLALVLDTPIGVTGGGNVTIFTVADRPGLAQAEIRIGSYNNGAPTISLTKTVNAGSPSNLANLFGKGCSLLGGCDYIEIVTTRTQGTAAAVEVDYVEVDGQIVEIAAPTPEPSVWLLMIVAFILTGARLKQLRKRQAHFVAPSASRNRLWPARAMLRTAHR
jgi:hypothetical protein